jgi:hypothetical protein
VRCLAQGGFFFFSGFFPISLYHHGPFLFLPLFETSCLSVFAPCAVSPLLITHRQMVYFYESNVVNPPAQIYMGKDKFENEDLIKYGLEEGLFHYSTTPTFIQIIFR